MASTQNPINNTLAASAITGTLGVNHGGIGVGTLTGIAKGNGTSAFTAAVAGTDYQAPISLTTTGTSGAATFTSNTLNIPQYSTSSTTINTLQIDQTPAGSTYGLLAGTVNGSNAVFTVSNSAYVSGSLMVFLNGQDQTQGASFDWVETSAAAGTFTFNTAPPTGSIVQVAYIKTATTTGTGNSPVILSTVAGINAKTVANTALYTAPAGKTAIITGAIIRCTAANTLSSGPAMGIGNVAGTNNIFASSTLTALTTTTAIFGFVLVGISISTAAAGVIYANIGTGATGTSQTIAVDLLGYLL